MKVPKVAIKLIKSFEGIEDGDPSTVNLDPYLDPVGIWTIGWGHAISAGKRLLRGEDDRALAKSIYPNGITLEQAEALLERDVAVAAADVERLFPVELTTGQFAALVSFTFNLGGDAISGSELRRSIIGGKFEAAAEQFGRWIYAGGKPMNGLIRRREAEKTLFIT